MTDPAILKLRAHARHAPWNARGLAAHATALADSAGMRPTSAVARAELSARGVRFYVANGLLDRPDGRGTAATYGYRHLLQLLAIRIRQREGQTLGVIKRELTGLAGDALERRVAQSMAAALSVGEGATVTTDDGVRGTWHRVELGPGVELHIRNDVGVATEDAVRLMREAFRAIGRSEE
jgi:DNA-binding transcriptional MerR regulator